MSASNLGATLLQEVEVEGLDEVGATQSSQCETWTDQSQLLRTLRSSCEAPHSREYTGQSTIDKLLGACQHPDSSRLRHEHPSNATARLPPDKQSAIPHNHDCPVLELVGISPCSGRTQLLYYLVGLFLLPSEYDNRPLRGRASAVVIIDLSNRFSVLRLRDIMINHVHLCLDSLSEPASNKAISILIRSSLDHLHIFRPQSSPSLFATLSNLQSYIFDTTSYASGHRQVGSVIVHHVDAFLWQNRLEDAEDPTNEGKTTQKSTLLSDRFRDLVAHLRNLQDTFSCLITATSSALSTTSYTRVDGLVAPISSSHLPNAWKSFVTARLLVKRDSVQKFVHGMSAEEAAREAGQRREAVEKCTFSARLDWSESDVWKEGTKSAIKALGGGIECHFKVTTSGLGFSTEDGIS
ncbi:MAG: hypothetical protein Q9219_003151 [cf. Caloplaca sp. 3 TL-2023]